MSVFATSSSLGNADSLLLWSSNQITKSRNCLVSVLKHLSSLGLLCPFLHSYFLLMSICLLLVQLSLFSLPNPMTSFVVAAVVL